MLDFLPDYLKSAIRQINLQKLYEVRLRVDKPVCVNYAGEYRFLGAYGLTNLEKDALRCTADDLVDCVFRAGKYSVYAVEEQINKGFLTSEKGERIGLAGEFVFENGKLLTIRNFTSVCIRIPHEIVGSGGEIYRRCLSKGLQNLLICSPPGIGKTTILRDLCRILSEKTGKNLLICDERGEISQGETGNFCDALRFCDKQTAFDVGIRTMRPHIIVTDELSFSDCNAVEKAINAGVIVLASAHFYAFEKIDGRFLQLFDLFAVLDGQTIGGLEGVYDKQGRLVV